MFSLIHYLVSNEEIFVFFVFFYFKNPPLHLLEDNKGKKNQLVPTEAMSRNEEVKLQKMKQQQWVMEKDYTFQRGRNN